MVCAIWGTVAEEKPITGDFKDFDSPRAGGMYRVTGTAEPAVASLTGEQKKQVTRWLVIQRLAGISVPEVTSHTLPLAKLTTPLLFSEKVQRVLLDFKKNVRRMDHFFSLNHQQPGPQAERLIALSDSDDARDLYALLKAMKEMGLLQDTGSAISVARFGLTPAGWQHLDNLAVKEVVSLQAFVAMWFDKETEAAFVEGIKPAIEEAGYRAFRIDKKEHVNKVDDEIIAEIRRSRFVVSDFSCEKDKPRGGVYFEAGFAMGLGLPVIWTCRKSSMNDLHFDTRQYNHIVWESSQDLRQQLIARIGAVIGDGPLKNIH